MDFNPADSWQCSCSASCSAIRNRWASSSPSMKITYVMTTAFIMRMFIFILLGTQVDFGLMNQYLYSGVAVVIVFMLVARPVTVFLCALPDRRAKWSFKEMLVLS